MAELVNTALFNDANLVSYFKLEDTADSKGAITLTNNNSATFIAAKYNNGGNLGTGNTNKFFSNASNNGFGISAGSFTIVGWVRILSQPATNLAFNLFDSEDTVTNVSEQLFYQDASSVKQFQFTRVKNGVSSDDIKYNIDPGTTGLNHLAYTYDGTNAIGWYNANPVGTVTTSGNGNSGAVAGVTLGINRNDGASNPSSIIWDDIGVFTRALTAGEINTLVSGGHTLSTGKYW